MELQPKIPFCRKAHAQVTARVGTSETILVFGGIGLDYTETSASGYLADLWSLNLVHQSFMWNEIFPVPGRQWPEQRKNFGYAVTQREGWLLVHGGEAFAASNILGDLWLHKDGNWICLDDASASASAAPAPRKNHALAVLPRSGQLFLMGGNGLIQKHGEQGTICHSDAYLLSLNAVLDGVADSGLEARARNASATTTWRAAASFPVPPRMRCFEGFSAVGVVDSSSWERREKVFVFGGRYTTSEARRRLSSAAVASSSSSSSATAAARRTASSSSSSSSSSASGSGSGSSSGNVTKVVREESHHAYSNQAWLYDPLDNEWTRLLPDVEGLPMPIGRDRHACAYVRELDTVFVSGGRSYTTPLEASRRDAKGGPSSDSAGSGTGSSSGSGSGNNTSGLTDRESQASTIMDLWGFNLSSRTWTEYSRGGDEGGGSGTEAGQVGKAGARALSRRQGSRALGSPRPRVPAARYEHTISVWRGVSGRDAPQLVLFGGQHELRRSSISSLGRRLGSGPGSDPAAPDTEGASASLQAQDARHSSKSSWGILSDDDSYGAIGKHSQLNDLWSFALQGPREAWRLVSVGGCSSGDNGLLDTKPAIDVTAVIFVGTIVGAFLIGILAHRGMLHLTRWLRGGDYEQIDDDERKAGMGAAPHSSTHGGVQMGPAGPLGQSVLGSPRRASPTLQRSMGAGQGTRV